LKKQKNTLKKLQNNKKETWLVALHAFSDTPNVFGQYIFKDYYEWLVFTIKFIKRNTQVNWIVKQHPHSQFYPDLFNYKKLKKSILKYRHIKFLNEKHDLEKSLPFSQIIHKCNGVVTCAGTIALQFFCLGKKQILCAEGYFSSLKFLRPCKNAKLYKKALLEAGQIKKAKNTVKRCEQLKALLALFLTFKNKRDWLTPFPDFQFNNFNFKTFFNYVKGEFP